MNEPEIRLGNTRAVVETIHLDVLQEAGEHPPRGCHRKGIGAVQIQPGKAVFAVLEHYSGPLEQGLLFLDGAETAIDKMIEEIVPATIRQ